MSILRRICIGCLVVYWVTLFVGTHLPGTTMQKVKTNDKLLHVVGYAGLAFLLCGAVYGAHPSLRRLLWCGLILAGYAIFDEATQTFVPGRSADPRDCLADGAGSVLGIAALVAPVTILRWQTARRVSNSDGASGAPGKETR